jgi:choline dehydrogenase-like flavoprotein
MENVFVADIDLVCELSKQNHYDFVIVGSGIGGGILARQLNESKKRVLLIEKGGVSFSTHCLNTSRPHWQIGSLQGPSQDNDVVYNAVKQTVQTAAGSDPYVGGPVYCLGGRSNVWGLYSPSIQEKKLRKWFPSDICNFLEETGYKEAFETFSNSSQEPNVYPRDDIETTEQQTAEEDLNAAINEYYRATFRHPKVPTVSLSPMAAEFKSKKLYNFPQGAYSTVDYLLDRTYRRDPNLTILLNTEVLKISDDPESEQSTLKLRTRSSDKIYELSAITIILSAGTLGTASIALNSGLQQRPNLGNVGKGLMDHEIWGVRFHKTTTKDNLKDPMKFQCRITIAGEDALLNVAINANTFLARDFSSAQHLDSTGKPIAAKDQAAGEKKFDTVNITIERQADLSNDNEVLNTASSEPVVRVTRTPNNKASEAAQLEFQKLATFIRNQILGISPPEPAPRLSVAGFGAVAHEVGTMRIKSPETTEDFVVDENLRVRGFSNLYVCDLSIFPSSLPANPSLTLAGISLYLAKKLLA